MKETEKTPLGTYQGLTDQIVLSRTPGSFRTVLVPRGSSKSEWLYIESTVPKSELLKPFMTKSANEVIHERDVGRDPAY